MDSEARVVQVVPLLNLRRLGRRSFDYLVPPAVTGAVRTGSIVSVPFGRRTVQAVVVAEGASGEVDPSRLQSVSRVASTGVPEDLLDLASALAGRYLAPLGACLKVVAPPGSAGKDGERAARTALWVHPVSCAVDEIRGAGYLTPRQDGVLAQIPADGMLLADLCRRTGASRSVVQGLVRKGVAVLRSGPSAPRAESPLTGSPRATQEPGGLEPHVPVLLAEQREALERLLAAFDDPQPRRCLLWGVTGSGKTEVYLRLVEEAVAAGRGVILLVPEIALTPQTVARVRERFGQGVAVLHSGLSRGDRDREYRRVSAGHARVVVGARSAVFAPLRELGVIIIDESHDASYKQEELPHYDARTVAWMRIVRVGGLLVEGSASPRVESITGGMETLRLRVRTGGAELPHCEVVDMRQAGGAPLLAPASRRALATAMQRGEQAIVLLNRRGYTSYVHCERCGHVEMCDRCELGMTYHRQEHSLMCHQCGRLSDLPEVCPECHGAPLTGAVAGTELIVDELARLVPGDRLFRLDSDVVTSGSRVHAVLDGFASSRPGVLVGTQMVAKGHDFPAVTCVIVADADTGLYLPDFRASERTFQLLVQASGRAGRRAGGPGRVLVQTWNPQAPCIRMATERDEAAFYAGELRLRERLGYPPYAEMIRLVLSAVSDQRVRAAAFHLAEKLRPFFAGEEVKGPARLPVVRRRSRWHLVISAREGERARAVVGLAMDKLADPYRRRGVEVAVDVDPLSFG